VKIRLTTLLCITIPVFTLAFIISKLTIGTYSMYTTSVNKQFAVTTLSSSQLVTVYDEQLTYGPNCRVSGSFKVKNLSNEDMPITLKNESFNLKSKAEKEYNYILNDKGHCTSYTVKIPIVGYNNYFTEYAIFNIDKNNLIKPNSSRKQEETPNATKSVENKQENNLKEPQKTLSIEEDVNKDVEQKQNSGNITKNNASTSSVNKTLREDSDSEEMAEKKVAETTNQNENNDIDRSK